MLSLQRGTDIETFCLAPDDFFFHLFPAHKALICGWSVMSVCHPACFYFCSPVWLPPWGRQVREVWLISIDPGFLVPTHRTGSFTAQALLQILRLHQRHKSTVWAALIELVPRFCMLNRTEQAIKYAPTFSAPCDAFNQGIFGALSHLHKPVAHA